MEKLVEKALQNHTPNVKDIMRVLKATGNITVAAEIYLGIYEEPKVSQYPSQSVRDSYCEAKFKEYDPFNNRVVFTYYYSDTVRGWVPVEETVYTTDRFVSTKTYAIDAATELDMSDIDFKLQYKRVAVHTNVNKDKHYQSDISLDTWNEDGINMIPVPERVFETESTTL